MNKKLRIILLEKEAEMEGRLYDILRQSNLAFSLERCANRESLAGSLTCPPPADLVLLNCAFSTGEGTDAVKLISELDPELPCVAIGGALEVPRLTALWRGGAADYVPETELAKLPEIIQRVLETHSLKWQQRLTKAALRDGDARFRTIFEATNAGMAVETLQGRIMETNTALQQMLGYAPEELRQLTRLKLSHSLDQREEDTQFQRLLNGVTPSFQVEKRFVRKDGRIIWVRQIVCLVRDAAGHPQFALAIIEDITNRLKAEESHLRYASVVEYSNDAIISTTFDGVIFSWNPAAERVYGYSSKEANGRSVNLIIPPELEEEQNQVMQRIKLGERVESYETVRLRKDGSRIDVFVTASPIFDVAGKIAGASTISRDVTDRKRAEKMSAAFSKLGEKLSSASSAVEAARIITDTASHLLGWDSCSLNLCSPDQKHFSSVLNVDIVDGQRADVVQAADEVVPSPISRSVMENGARLILRKPPFESSAEFNRFGNTSRASASLMFVPVRNGPKVIGELTIQSYTPNAYTQTDLETLQSLADHCGGALERIRTEAENHKLATFAQCNPYPVLELSAEAEVKYWNDAASEVVRSLGLQHPREFLPPDIKLLVKNCLEKGESRVRHQTTIHDRIFSWYFFPVEATRSVHCYAGDITDLHNLEAQLRQSQKMESIGQLAGGIAHDFNNILTVIQGHLSLMSMNASLSEKAQESARQIGLAADRAANLTRQLLTFSRRQVMQLKTIDLNEVVKSMSQMLHRVLGEHITLQVNCAEEPPLIHADQGMLEQILLNLSVNARDAMPGGGTLFISTGITHVDAYVQLQIPDALPGSYACLTVRDTGMGIAPEVLPHIFEPFFTTKDVGKGTGLGLATVYGIVRQHKGWIRANSCVGKETVFQIYLPVVQTEKTQASPESHHPTSARGGTETILVVEDEAPLRMLVRAVLERYGYRVLEAESGVAALPVWEKNGHEVKLLLTDMVMPEGLSGRDLATKLLAEKPALKVIYCSGYSQEIIGSEMGLREGLNFLPKPYHPVKLAQAVRDSLDAGN